jgi:hypothetical protein
MKIKIYYSLLLICFFTVISCEDLIDKKPLDSPSSASFFNDKTEVDMGLYGCYERLANRIGLKGNRPWIVMLDNTTDISWNRSAHYVQDLGNGTANSQNLSCRNAWGDFYAIIARTNFLLDNIQNAREVLTPDYYDQVIAEARFIRAYSYFYLSELFGGVPLVTAGISLEEAEIARTSKDDIANWIIDEMDEAAPDLPVYFDGNTGRATSVAAYFLKAKTALCNEKWAVAAQAAQAAIDLGHYGLHPDYAELFTYDGEYSNEIIFAMQYLEGINVHDNSNYLASRLGKGVSNEVPTQPMVDSYECIDGLPIDESPLFDPQNPYENRDPRLDMSIVRPGTIFYGFQFETHPDSLKIWNYNVSPPARINNTDATNPYATFTSYLWRKWTDIRDMDDDTNCDGDIILMRYAELLLIYAEAKIEANDIDDSVYDALDDVRERAGMPAMARNKTQAELRSVVRRERKVELANEGHRLIDIRRWRIAEEVMNGPRYGNSKTAWLQDAPELDENTIPDYSGIPNNNILRVVETMVFNPNRDYLWPIYPVEIETNPALTQNPNW